MLKPHDLHVITCYLAGVICQVAEGIAIVGWICVVDVITKWQMEQPRVCLIQFKF